MKIVLLLCALVAMAECSVMRRVVNGHPLDYGEWPFLVSLHYLKPNSFTSHNGMEHMCGGTLIDKEWVLTAAHCFNGHSEGMRDSGNWKVYLGEYSQYQEDYGEQVRGIDAIYIHQGFNENNQLYDMAMVRLSEPAEVSQYVGIMNINTENERDQSRLHCKVGGWGQMAIEPVGYTSYVPLQADVFTISNKQCMMAYNKVDTQDFGKEILVDDSVLCAGIPPEKQSRLKDQNNDVCAGDSGDPLVCKIGYEGEWRLTGVVSYAASCGRDDYPGLYNRVSFFANWIDEIMNGRKQTEPTFEEFDDVDLSSSKAFGNVYA